MALPYGSNWDPQLELSDSLMGLIVEPDPGFDMASLLKPVPSTYLDVEPKPASVRSLNSSPSTTPSVHSLHQVSYCTNAPMLDRLNAEFVPNLELEHQQSCINHFSTNPRTNPGNFIYQNPDFSVGLCTDTVQGMVVPAVKSASARNVAARARTKKISEKTQELARLIPGGLGKGTADILQASSNYVKFLQAQIGILAMMDSKEAMGRTIDLLMCINGWIVTFGPGGWIWFPCTFWQRARLKGEKTPP